MALELDSSATESTLHAVPNNSSAVFRSQACGGIPSMTIQTLKPMVEKTACDCRFHGLKNSLSPSHYTAGYDATLFQSSADAKTTRKSSDRQECTET